MEGKAHTTTGKERPENDERYFRIVQSIPDAILLTRLSDDIVLDINDAFEELTGYRREEILGDTSRQLSLSLDSDLWTRAIQELEAKGEVREIETNMFRMDGRLVYVLISLRRLEVAGEPCQLHFIRDITERKRAEETLQENERRVRRKLDAILSPEGNIGELGFADIIDAQVIQSLMGDFYKLAHIPMSITDLKGKVLVGVGWQDICMKFHRVHPETCRHCVESDTQLSAGLHPGEFRLYKCKNNMWDIATPLIMGGQHVGNIFSGQFFFEEEPLDYELFRLQARQYGFDEQAYIAALGAVPRLSKQSVDTGMTFFMKFAHMLSRLSYGNIKLTRSLAERDALMDSLQESEQRYRNLFNGVPVGIFRTTSDGHILDANPAVIDILGYPNREALLAINAVSLYVSQDDRRQWRCKADSEGIVHGFETRLRRLDGRIIWVHISGRIVHDEGERVTYNEGVLEDITERKHAEEALRQAQEELVRKEKLAILGQLAGTVGHEIRNPLGVMNNAVYFLKTVMPDADETVKEYLDLIKGEISNCRRTIAELFDFSRTRTPQFIPVTVGTVIGRALEKCRIPENVDLRVHVPDTLPEVSVDPFQMGQVFQNLITNAVQAMEGGGALRIAARRVQSGREDNVELRTLNSVSDREFVEISVTDTGEGITPENMERLFQPLFTTKTKGIGFGLAICRNLTEANGGRIEVESEPGRGTTFTVILPLKGGKE
jgi:PAS domain S-box-containing protein